MPNADSGFGRLDNICLSSASRDDALYGACLVSAVYKVACKAQTSSDAVSPEPLRRSGGQNGPMAGATSCDSTGAIARPAGTAITLRGESAACSAPAA